MKTKTELKPQLRCAVQMGNHVPLLRIIPGMPLNPSRTLINQHKESAELRFLYYV
jgi:hypothetical protein